MTFRFVDKGWGQVMREAGAADASALRMIWPFIKKGALLQVLDGPAPDGLQVITRFNLPDFADGVGDINALHLLLARDAARATPTRVGPISGRPRWRFPAKGSPG